MFITVKPFPNLEKSNARKLALSKQTIKIGNTIRDFNNMILPISLNDYYYGLKLNTIKNEKNIIKSVYIEDNIGHSFVEHIKEQSILFNGHINEKIEIDFYLYKNKLGKKYVILSMWDEIKKG